MAKKVVSKKVGHPTEFASQEVLKKYYKKLTTQEVEAWASDLGVTYVACDDASIHRMRVCMAILYKFYPRQVSVKAKSKYSEYTTEWLVSTAADNNVPVEVCDDMRILRMRTIMALRAHGILG